MRHALVVVALAGCLESTVGDGDVIAIEEPQTWESPMDQPPTGMVRSLFGAGFCALAEHGYNHIVANKFASDLGAKYFDLVRGDAYVRELEVCIGYSAGQGGTWVLPANVESTTGEIYQLGYGRGAGRQSNYFVYALATPTAQEITSAAPIDGHRYRFEIYKRTTSSTVSFRITDLTTATVVWTFDSDHAWSSAADHAWWGFETWDSASHHGVSGGKLGVQMAYLGYSTETESFTRYRSDLTCKDIWKNFTWDGSTSHDGCTGKRIGSMGTWVYGGDMLDAITY